MNNINIMWKTYSLIERAVEDGIRYGYKRAHKHTDDPHEEDLKQTILEAIMQELSEIINFDENK